MSDRSVGEIEADLERQERSIMAAPKGNQFWKARSRHGRRPLWEDAGELWEACEDYFEWVESNPLKASELVKFQGKSKVATVPRMRAMTISGLCIFLGIDPTTWIDYGKKKGFSHITTRVEEIIRQQKFEGAAADLLNSNIIARDLGLADKKELKAEVSGKTDKTWREALREESKESDE